MKDVNRYVLASTLIFSAIACSAQEQRYLAIQHTDTIYANQGICAYNFSLDSGGADEDLVICISRCNLMTKRAKRLVESTLEVEPFGGSSASLWWRFWRLIADRLSKPNLSPLFRRPKSLHITKLPVSPISTFTPKFHQPPGRQLTAQEKQSQRASPLR